MLNQTKINNLATFFIAQRGSSHRLYERAILHLF